MHTYNVSSSRCHWISKQNYDKPDFLARWEYWKCEYVSHSTSFKKTNDQAAQKWKHTKKNGIHFCAQHSFVWHLQGTYANISIAANKMEHAAAAVAAICLMLQLNIMFHELRHVPIQMKLENMRFEQTMEK